MRSLGPPFGQVFYCHYLPLTVELAVYRRLAAGCDGDDRQDRAQQGEYI